MAEEKARAKKILLGVKDDVNDDRRQFNIVSVITDGDELCLEKCYNILLANEKELTDDQNKVFIAAKSILEFKDKPVTFNHNPVINFENLKNYTVVNSYYDESSSGIGDFLRGCCYLHGLFSNEKIDFNIDFSKHTVGKYLNSQYKGDKKKIFDTERENKEKTNPSTYFKNMHDNLEKILNVKPKKIWQVIKEKIVLFSNYSDFVFMSDEGKKNLALDDNTKNFMKSNLRFSKEVEKTFMDLDLKNYIVMHYRLGDFKIVEEHKLSVKTDDNNINTKNFNVKLDPIVDEVVKKLLETKKQIVLISDSNDLKKYIKDNMPDRYISKVSIAHVNSFHTSSNPGFIKNIITKDTNKPEKMFYVALDMKICTKASEIYSKSVYPWGSGFTYWISKIYNIPITCEKIDE